MNIYVVHLRNFDFKKELYEPIRQSSMNSKHTFILPHENSNKPFRSKDYLKNKANLVIAEVSKPSTGLGIELGWADIYNVPVVCAYRKGSKIAGSLKIISKNFIEYSNSKELIYEIEKYLIEFDNC